MPNLDYWYSTDKIPRSDSTVFFDNGDTNTVEPNWISLNELNQFYGWKCNIGVDTLFVNKAGELSGACSESLYNLNFKYNILASDFKEKFNPVITPTICKKQKCTCQPEINCTKEFGILDTTIIPIISI